MNDRGHIEIMVHADDAMDTQIAKYAEFGQYCHLAQVIDLSRRIYSAACAEAQRRGMSDIIDSNQYVTAPPVMRAKHRRKPMKSAFTLIELMIVISIIAIIAAIAIPNLLDNRRVKIGSSVVIKASGVHGVVVGCPHTALEVRIDNGPGAVPRYTVTKFMRDEVVPDLGVER